MMDKKIKAFKIAAYSCLSAALLLLIVIVAWLAGAGWRIFSVRPLLPFFVCCFFFGVILLVACLCFVKVMNLSYERENVLICSHCGGENKRTDVYCSSCGRKL